MLLKDCFFNLSNFPSLDQKYVSEGLNAEYPDLSKFKPPFPKGTVPRIISTKSSFQETNFFKILEKQFGDISCVYIRNFPSSNYDWHCDILTNVNINFILHDNRNSLVLFRDRITEYSKIQYKISQVIYNPLKPTILNTQVQHCVINLDDDYRYILNLGFLNKSVSYQDVKNFLINFPMFDSY
jgi:hypothetical protein